MIMGLCLSLELVGTVWAVEKKQPTGTAPKRSTTVAPLTEGECVGLGGKIRVFYPDNTCATGKLCITTDKDGVIHSACINAEKH